MFSQPRSTAFLRPLRVVSQTQVCLRNVHARRHLSQTASRRAPLTTPPAHKPRSFKSSLARWAIAIGGVYWYANSDFFAPNGPYARQLISLDSRIPNTDEENEQLPTVDEVNRQRRERQAKQREQYRQQERERISASPQASSDPSTSTPPAPSSSPSMPSDAPSSSPQTISPDALEDEADQQGAFNEETGEINWDCPCLGGMAYGPCGEQFREAFSCFVYSKEEPKGIECVDRFKAMQDCFRLHPDVYGAELADEEPSEEELAAMRAEQPDAQIPAAAGARGAEAEAQKQ